MSLACGSCSSGIHPIWMRATSGGGHRFIGRQLGIPFNQRLPRGRVSRDVAWILLEAGATPDVVGPRGERPLDLAQESPREKPRLAELLRDYFAVDE